MVNGQYEMRGGEGVLMILVDTKYYCEIVSFLLGKKQILVSSLKIETLFLFIFFLMITKINVFIKILTKINLWT